MTIVLSMPYTLWICKIVASDEDLSMGLVRARLRKPIYQKRAADEVKATAERRANKDAA